MEPIDHEVKNLHWSCNQLCIEAVHVPLTLCCKDCVTALVVGMLSLSEHVSLLACVLFEVTAVGHLTVAVVCECRL